jgi:trimethylamine--corrinoid protein Co-methyltransferase
VTETGLPARARRRGSRPDAGGGVRRTDYGHLRNPFPAIDAVSADHVEAIHRTALRVLEELGIKVLLPEARAILKSGGALVDEDSQMVRFGSDVVAAALACAPRSIPLRAGAPHRDLVLELGTLAIQPGAGAPHATDLVKGRRPGSLGDLTDLLRLTHHFDVLHMLPPLVEPQDIAIHLRHLAMTEVQLTVSDKVPFVFSRGTAQAMDCF